MQGIAITPVYPAPRIWLTASCMDAVWYGVFCDPYVASSLHPACMKQAHPTVVSPHGARITLWSCLNVAAIEAHIAGAWLSSGAIGWWVARLLPGAAHINDTSAYIPYRCSSPT